MVFCSHFARSKDLLSGSSAKSTRPIVLSDGAMACEARRRCDMTVAIRRNSILSSSSSIVLASRFKDLGSSMSRVSSRVSVDGRVGVDSATEPFPTPGAGAIASGWVSEGCCCNIVEMGGVAFLRSGCQDRYIDQMTESRGTGVDRDTWRWGVSLVVL